MDEPNIFLDEDQAAAVEAARDKAKIAEKQEKEDLIWLMSGKRGRRIVRSLLRTAGVWRISFNTNAMQMAFNEGRRNDGLILVSRIMEYCPQQYTELLLEGKDD